MNAPLFKQQRGGVAVEFALLAPYLIALLLMSVEFGRIYYNYQRVQMSAFDAARYISTRLPSSGDFNLEDLQQNENHPLRRRSQLVAVYGIPRDTGNPILPDMAIDHVEVDFDDIEPVLDTSNQSTARQSTCRVLSFIGDISEFESLFDRISDSGYCASLDGNLVVRVTYPYQPIFSQIPFVGIDTDFTLRAQASMRVF